MAAPVPLRSDFDAPALRALAKGSRDPAQTRRLLALSVISEGGSRSAASDCTERLAEAGIEPSVGSVGDFYDNALAETIIGLFKAEVIHRRGP